MQWWGGSAVLLGNEARVSPSPPAMTTIPTLHLNGTGRTTLRDEYAVAYNALLKAREAFASTTCNGRDFYPQGPDAYYKARDERIAAFAGLEQTIKYVGEVLTGICDQM